MFDGVDHDDFGAYDETTGVLTVPRDGAYHVHATVDWADFFDDDSVKHMLTVNGSALTGLSADTTEYGRTARSSGRTLFDLSAGDTVEIAVEQQSGTSKDVEGFTSGRTPT